jgi:long-chain fatty acid transport protein
MTASKFRLFAVIVLLYCLPLRAQTGHVAHGVGAVNQSMAGAGTALPLDATGALFWNPASISDLKSSEVDINGDVVLLHSELSSSVAAFSGSSSTDFKHAFLGSVAWVQQPKKSRWTFGFMAATVGGFGFTFKNNGRNPITTPPPPRGLGVGEVRTQYRLLQAIPALAYEINDHLYAGVAPSLGVSSLKSDPFPFTSPDDANRDGFPTYPQTNTAWAVGGGVQLGIYYKSSAWHAGASVKSPQWFQSFKFDSHNELGEPRSFKFRLDYPMIVTTGIAYSGFDRFDWAADVRYIDYQNTKGFDRTGFDPSGAVRGLGWNSIWVFATGLQARVSDRFRIRGGYGFNGNPIRDIDTFFNLGSALITQHQGNVGLSYQLKQNVAASFAYHRGFENGIQGPYQSPADPVPGTSVHSKFGNDVFVLSFNIRVE